MAALTLFMALAFAVLSLDAGRLWFERRSVQRAADMAAMASARFTGCGSSAAEALNAGQATATANGIDFTDKSNTITVTTGAVSFNAKGVTVFTPSPVEASNGTQVTLTKEVPTSIILGGFFSKSTTTLSATAVAEGGPPVATYSVGSVFGISANGAQQITNLFKGVLGNSAPNLDPAAITQLVSATVTLAALQQAAGAATLNDFLNQQMTMRQFLDLIATASPSAAALASFQQLYNASLNSSVKLQVGQILSIQSPAASGVASANISVFDLINAGINVGALNQGGLINLSLGLNLLGKTSLSILSPPIIAIGPAGKGGNGDWCSKAQSAQMSLRTTINPLGLGIVDMALRLDLMSTIGHLEALSVAPGDISGTLSSQSVFLTLALTRSADINNDISSSANFRPATVLGGVVGVKIFLPIAAALAKPTDFSVTSKDGLPIVKLLGAGSVGASLAGLLGDQTNITVTVLFGLFKLPINFLDDLIRLVTVPVGQALDGLLAAFGIQTGSVNLQVLDVNASVPVPRR